MIAEPSSSRCRLAAESTCPGSGLRLVDRRMEARARALQRLERERTGEIGRPRQPPCAHERERRHRRHELGAVDQRQPFLRAQADRLEPGGGEGLRAREQCPLEPGLAFADERQRQMSQRSEVAARADRAAGRHPRQDTAVEAFDQQLDCLDPRAREPLRERVRPQQHRRAHDLRRIRLAHTAGVAAQQPQLELVDLVGGDGLGDEATEARVDAVGVLGRLVDERPRRLHLTARLVGEADGRAVHGYLPDVLQPQVVPVQRVTQNHAASLDPGQ